MKKLIKKNIKNLTPSATLATNEISKKMQLDGKKVFRFGFGQSPFPIPNSIVDEFKKNAHKKDYQQMQGLPALRSAIAKYLKKKKLDFNDQDIIIGPGTKELMFLLQIAFSGDGILAVPSWVSYFPHTLIGRNKIHLLETTREDNWFPNINKLEKILNKNKKKNILLF